MGWIIIKNEPVALYYYSATGSFYYIKSLRPYFVVLELVLSAASGCSARTTWGSL